MKKSMLMLGALSMMLVSNVAMAEDNPLHIDKVRLGFSADLGLPDGLAAGIVVHPRVNYLVLGGSLTYNALSFGGRLDLKVDPLAYFERLPIGVFYDLQGGEFFEGHIPGHSDLPSVGYGYINNFAGLRLGRSVGFQWDFLVGTSYIAARTSNFQSVVPSTKGLTVGNPSANIWLTPAFQTGFNYVF